MRYSSVALFGKIECCQGEVRHTFERDEIPLLECVGMIGEKLEQSARLSVSPQKRQNNNGGNAESAAGFEVHPRIGFRVIATQQLAARNAFTG